MSDDTRTVKYIESHLDEMLSVEDSERIGATKERPLHVRVMRIVDDYNFRGELLNNPETSDFIKAVPLEAGHQRARWGDEHDRSKAPEAWMFLFGFLAGKAVQARKSGDLEKAKHHAITAAAALANFHRTVAEPMPAESL